LERPLFALSVSDGDLESMSVKRYGKVPIVLIPTRNLSLSKRVGHNPN